MPLNGIDISGWQAGIPQSVINQADVLIVKATESTNFVSPELFTQFAQGVSANKKVGVYHFARPGDASAQADYFVNQVTAQELTPDFWVLDYEDNSMLTDTEWPLRFMQRVKELTGQPVWFYCYMAPMKLYAYSSIRAEGFKHWIAGYPYGQQNGFGPQMSLDAYITWSGLNSDGIDFAGWQYSSQGRLNGWSGDLDLNWFFDDAFSETSVSTDKMNDPMEAALSWFYAREGRVSYSMDMRLRQGPDYYDCSSAVYSALIAAGILSSGTRLGNTESMFDELPQHGFEKLTAGPEGYLTRRGDVFIWGDKGTSTGGAGHTGIFVNEDDIIHCNFGYNNITVNNHNLIWSANGGPSLHIYRYKGSETNQGDWLSMATKEEVEAVVRKVLNERIDKQGGPKGKTSVTTEAAWAHANFDSINNKLDNIARMLWLLNDTFRIGIPGVVSDGTLGPIVRRLIGYGSDSDATKSGGLPAARKARYEKAAKNNWSWWA